VLPGAFVDVAEQSRLITAIDAWVVRQACADMAQCQETEISVAVNLSGRDLEDESLLDAVSQALHRTGLASHRLMVELTETMLLAEGAHVAAHLAQIQSLGVQVAIDDFGTGYSSLSYLRRLPVQALKIDRSFVASIDHDEVAAAIVGAVVAMSHALGLHVVAEGVERPGQEIRLRQLGCDAAQGYLFARPQPIAEALLAVRALDGSPVATVPPPPPETTAGLHRN
jgi:EAL domain-containing protein (putative c-di-GMP-specific phosphodiesterase class I)